MHAARLGARACTALAKAANNSTVSEHSHAAQGPQVQTCIQKAMAFQRPCSVMSSRQYRSCSHSHPAVLAGGRVAGDLMQGQLHFVLLLFVSHCGQIHQQPSIAWNGIHSQRPAGWPVCTHTAGSTGRGAAVPGPCTWLGVHAGCA